MGIPYFHILDTARDQDEAGGKFRFQSLSTSTVIHCSAADDIEHAAPNQLAVSVGDTMKLDPGHISCRGRATRMRHMIRGVHVLKVISAALRRCSAETAWVARFTAMFGCPRRGRGRGLH